VGEKRKKSQKKNWLGKGKGRGGSSWDSLALPWSEQRIEVEVLEGRGRWGKRLLIRAGYRGWTDHPAQGVVTTFQLEGRYS